MSVDYRGTPEEVDQNLRALCERDHSCDCLSNISAMCITCGAAITLNHQRAYIQRLLDGTADL